MFRWSFTVNTPPAHCYHHLEKHLTSTLHFLIWTSSGLQNPWWRPFCITLLWYATSLWLLAVWKVIWHQLCFFQLWRHPSSRILNDVISRRLTSKSMSVHVLVSYFSLELVRTELSYNAIWFTLTERARECTKWRDAETFSKTYNLMKNIFFWKTVCAPKVWVGYLSCPKFSVKSVHT